MSIRTQIQRLEAAKSELAAALEAKGVPVPQGSTLDQYAPLVGQIKGGMQGGMASFQASTSGTCYACIIYADGTVEGIVLSSTNYTQTYQTEKPASFVVVFYRAGQIIVNYSGDCEELYRNTVEGYTFSALIIRGDTSIQTN